MRPFWLLFAPWLFSQCGVLAQIGAFGGSERIKDLEESFKAIVEDKEHIQEEFPDIFTMDEVQRMEEDEVSFNWFYAHDGDLDEQMDGLELFKAVLHSTMEHQHPQHRGGYADESNRGNDDNIGPSAEQITLAVDLVDEILDRFDLNNDGYLDYPEFKLSFTEHGDLLNKRRS